MLSSDINTEGGPQPTAPQQEAIEQEAATRIQAYYRGYNSRRSNNQPEQDEQEEVKPIDIANSQSQDNRGQKIIENEKMDQNEVCFITTYYISIVYVRDNL